MQNINELGDSSTIKIDEKTSGNNNEAKIIEKENKKQTNGKNSKKILMEKKLELYELFTTKLQNENKSESEMRKKIKKLSKEVEEIKSSLKEILGLLKKKKR